MRPNFLSNFNPNFRSNFAGPPTTSGPQAVVILSIGQSNQVGFDESGLTAITDDPLANMFQLSRGIPRFEYPGLEGSNLGIIPAYQPLQHDQDYASKGVGMSFVFTKLLAAQYPNKTFYIVPCAQGSTGFTAQWGAPAGTLYVSALSRAASLIYQLLADGYSPGNISMIVNWHQGEGNRESPLYETYMADMMTGIRTEFSDYGTIPLVAGTIRRDTGGKVNAMLWSLMESMDDVAVASMIDLADVADGVHFTNASLRTAGQRQYDAYLKLLANDATRLDITPDDTPQLAATSPTRLYKFDDLTSSVGGPNLVQVNNPKFTNSVAAFGKIGAGTYDYFDTDIVHGTNPAGVSRVAKFRAGRVVPADGSPPTSAIASDQRFHLELSQSRQLKWTCQTGVLTSPATYDDGLWHIVAVTYNSNSTVNPARMYVDGVLVASGSLTDFVDSSSAVRIGLRASGINPLLAELDHVALYTRELSDAEAIAVSTPN